jgi:hypothetical protein
MARFTFTSTRPTAALRVRVDSVVHYVDLVPAGTKADIVFEEFTDRGRTSLRPYVIGPNRQYKTLAAAVAALIKERT